MIPSYFRYVMWIVLWFIMLNISVLAAPQQSTWTVDEALHLGRKALFYVSPAMRDQLTSAWSVTAAVDILFPNQDWPLKTQYDAAISGLLAKPWFVLEWSSNHSWANRYYHTILTTDPYEAKAKLSLLWYDIFAVNREWDIRIADIVDQQKLIYQYTLWNYKTLVQRHMFNNSNPLGVGVGWRWDYAVGKFIDLLRQNVSFPNENYSRELLQLFLMWEYDILETTDTAEPNYTDQDVIALAKKLTGLEDDPVTHQVTFNPAQRNLSSGVQLLSWPLAPGYTASMFPYWDAATDKMNLANAHVSIAWSNGVMDNAINYIFAKREATISRYIAFLLYKYYVDDRVQHNNVTDPTARANIQELADKFIENDYEILPTVKWLLTRDWMYTSSISDVPENKNPVELAIGTIKALNHRSGTWWNDVNLMDGDLLTRLWWTPYRPGSIFWRDGFNDANWWLDDYLINLWMSQSTSFPFNNYISAGGTWAVWSGRFAIMWSTWIIATWLLSPMDYVNQLEEVFRWKQNILPATVKTNIVNYLTSGGTITFDPTNSWYVDTKMRWAISMMLSQPEYLLKQWMNAPHVWLSTTPSVIAWTNKIVFLELFWWYDWIYWVLPKDQYLRYVSDRSTLAVPFNQLLSLWGNFINNALQPLVWLDTTNELMLINGVGNPRHSRWHDTAQRQSTSAYNKQEFGVEGMFWNLIKNDDPSNTYVLWLNKPNIFSHGKYTNIWPSSSKIRFVGSPWNVVADTEKALLVDAIKSTILAKPQTDYPWEIGKRYDAAISLDQIAYLPWPSEATRQLSGQLAYIKKLMDNNKWYAYYAVGWGWFDTHANQNDPTVLKNKMQSYANDIRNFFDNAKNAGHNVTIIVHTEFGRTIKRNGTNGTDHGEWWWYFIISNNNNIKNSFSAKSYGRIDLTNSKRDWLGIGIDYRAIYNRIFDWLYWITPATVAGYDLQKEIDTTPPRFTLLHPVYKANNDSSVSVSLNSKIFDVNYRPTSMAAHMWAGWWSTGSQYFAVENLRNTQRYIILDDENILYKKDRQPQLTGRWYAFTGMDNQHITNFVTGYLYTPRIVTASQFAFSWSTDHVFRAFENTTVQWTLSLSTPISLSPSTYSLPWSSLSMVVSNPTQVVSVNGSGERHGWFLLPQIRDIKTFVHPTAVYNGIKLDNMTLDHIIQVWPDAVGVRATTDQPVTIRIPVSWTSPRDILISTDGITWSLFSGAVTPSAGLLQFTTTNLWLFAIRNQLDPSCQIIANPWVWAYKYDIARTTKNATNWTLSPSGMAGTTLTGSTTITVTPNQSYTYTLNVSNTNFWTNSWCSVTFIHKEVLNWTAPTCNLTSSPNATWGSYTLSRSFGGGQLPLSATLSWSQDVGDIMNLAVTTKTTTPPANAITTYTLTTRGINSEQTCTTTINTITTQNPPSWWWSSWWGWTVGWWLIIDMCPWWDFSPSYFDGICMSNGVILPPDYYSNNNQNNDSTNNTNTNNQSNNTYISQSDLIDWLYEQWFTRYNTVADYRPDVAMTREQFSRMVVVADKIYNPNKKPGGFVCDFADSKQFNPTLVDYIMESCERGLLLWSKGNFMPKMYVTYSQATAVIERILNGPMEQHKPRWDVYMQSAKQSWYLPYSRPTTAPWVYGNVSRWTWWRLLYNTAVMRWIE